MQSQQLDSWLTVQPDLTLRLFDMQGQLRLTNAEFQAQQAEFRAQQLQLQTQQLEFQNRDLEAGRKEIEKLRNLLRSLGQNPDDLEKL